MTETPIKNICRIILSLGFSSVLSFLCMSGTEIVWCNWKSRITVWKLKAEYLCFDTAIWLAVAPSRFRKSGTYHYNIMFLPIMHLGSALLCNCYVILMLSILFYSGQAVHGRDNIHFRNDQKPHFFFLRVYKSLFLLTLFLAFEKVFLCFCLFGEIQILDLL